MEDIVLQRVRQFMKKEHLTNKGLAGVLEMTEANLSNKLNGIRKIDLSTLCVLLDKFPDLSAEWLLRGEGNMYKSKNYDQPKMSFGQFLLSTLTKCSKSEAMKVKNVVDSVVELKENEE